MDTKSSNLNFDRKSAFKIDLSQDQKNQDNKIVETIDLEGTLHCFSTKSISIIELAEEIDPENTAPETRNSFQEIYSIGTEHFLVSRSIIQTYKLLSSIHIHQELEKSTLINHAWKCSKELLECENILHSLYIEIMSALPECDKIVEEGKNSTQISSLPRVRNLEGLVASFLSHSKKLVDFTHHFLTKCFRAPFYESNPTVYREWLQKHHPEKEDLIQLLETNGKWLKHVAHLRNALPSNHQKSGYAVHIENFKLNAGNTFSSPSWAFDFSNEGYTQDDPSDLLLDLNRILTEALEFHEEFILLIVQNIWEKNFPYEIAKLAESQMDPECPIRYVIQRKPTV